MEKELKLNEVIERMKILTDEGYVTYFKGRGNGDVQAIAEVWEIK
jgi:hypothetical protein